MNAAVWHADFAAALLAPSAPLPPGLAGRDAQRRFAVYRNNIAASVCDALAATFPVVHALVGDDCFRALAIDYLRAQPARSPLVLAHGAGLPDFLAAYPPTASLPSLADIARLEYLRLQAFYAADAAPLPAASFVRLSEQPDALARSHARLHPACRWLRSQHAVHAIWHAHQPIDGFDRERIASVAIDTPEEVVCVRPGLDVDVLRAPAGAATLLHALQNGERLGAALAAALAEDAGRDLPALLALLVTPGVLLTLESTDEDTP